MSATTCDMFTHLTRDNRLKVSLNHSSAKLHLAHWRRSALSDQLRLTEAYGPLFRYSDFDSPVKRDPDVNVANGDVKTSKVQEWDLFKSNKS